MSIYIPENIKVIVEGNNGDVLHSQYLSEFLQKPELQIQMATYGKTLLDVLLEESYISEDLVLKHIFTGNAHADATRLIGSIAESLVVNLCNTYPEVNRTLGMYARFGQRPHKSLDSYVAVATGSMRAKNYFRQHYNPSDTQRDIIWVEKDNSENQLLCIRSGSSSSAKPAGLQVKASHDGLNYVLPTIQNYHYPVLYFDLNGDWGSVQKAVHAQFPNAVLINPDEIQHEIKHILRGYFDIIVALLRNEVSLEQVIRDSRYKGESMLSTGIDGGEVTWDSKLILPSHLR
ncbi:TPA: hypothetical protein ACGF4V_001848 [Vibrio cholerae]|uniref:hypothetical protein n=1 Tax=Vibrio cholerae TaxID=666 RepID=UPI000AAED901|nr:hypothetical protein [Vibrio cholerae]